MPSSYFIPYFLWMKNYFTVYYFNNWKYELTCYLDYYI